MTYRDFLVGVAKHGDEHIEQDNDDDAAVRSEHQPAHKLCECVFLLQIKMLQVDQTKGSKV